MRKFSDTLKTLARSVAVAGLIGTAGVAVSTAPAVAQMHGGGGGFHGGGFGGGGFHGGGFHGSSGGFHGGDGGFRGDARADRGAFRGDFHRGHWVRGRWIGSGWYGVDVDPYDNPYGCSYYDYYYGYCDY